MSFFHFSFCNLFSINNLTPFLSPHLFLTNRVNSCKLVCCAVSQKVLFWNSIVPKKLSCWLSTTYNRDRLTGLCGHFEQFLHKLLKLNNLLTFHVERFPGVPILSPFRRFSPRFLAFRRIGDFRPAFSRFGGSAVRVGRRSAETRVAPNNLPDPLATCRRSAETPI